MTEIRNILTLLSSGYGTKHIAKVLPCSRNTVKYYRDLVHTHSLRYEDLLKEPEETLAQYFTFDIKQTARYHQLESTFPYVTQELKRVGVTLFCLWNEYKLHHPDGYSYSHYCKYYRDYIGNKQCHMHLTHHPGEKLFIDFSGKKLSYIDRSTGEIIECEFFVSLLPSSQLTYAQATHSQRTEDFLDCVNNTLQYFGGVPRVLVPDNLKSAITKADKYESEINSQFGHLAVHYQCQVLPARVRKPKDKALVESHVNILYTRVFAQLRNTTFFSLQELNAAIMELVEKHNQTPFQGKEYSRRELFEKEEKTALQPLPQHPFELITQRIATAMKNSYIQLLEDNHYYSIPHRYIGEKLTISYNTKELNIYHKGERIAYYLRNRRKYAYTTTPDHLPSTHRFVSEWNPDMFIKMGNEIDAAVGTYISHLLEQKNYPEQLYRSCMGVLSFAKKKDYKKERLIDACKSGLYAKVYSYTYIKNVLKNKTEQLYQQVRSSASITLPTHEQIRGAEYYKNQLLNHTPSL